MKLPAAFHVPGVIEACQRAILISFRASCFRAI